MADDPAWLKFLERLGFNVTRIRWRLYQMEKRSRAEKRLLPDSLRWLEYEHTICLHCGAIVPRGDSVCPKCERRVPGIFTYRILRLLRVVVPKDSPVVSGAFLGVMLLVFALGLVLEGGSAFMNPSMDTTVLLGSFSAMPGQPWQDLLARALTFALVHGGILHIAFNAYALYQVGPITEMTIGARRALVLVTVTQLASAVATYAWYSQVYAGRATTVGASGFLCGLVGFGIGYCHAQGPAGAALRNHFLRWAGYVIVIGLFIGANNAAHAGGLIAGLVLGVGLYRERRFSRTREKLWNVLAAACVAAWVASIAWVAYSALHAPPPS